MTDATGKIIGRQYAIRARAPVQYRFSDLHKSLTKYLEAVATMLQKLSEIAVVSSVERKARSPRVIGALVFKNGKTAMAQPGTSPGRSIVQNSCIGVIRRGC
jgi:hypothetical protein